MVGAGGRFGGVTSRNRRGVLTYGRFRSVSGIITLSWGSYIAGRSSETWTGRVELKYGRR